MRGVVLWLLSLAAFCAGCVPSFASLVEARRYPDALCHASSRAHALALIDAVERDADARVHLYAVRDAELRKALGDEAEKVSSKVTLVRLAEAHNRHPASAAMTARIRGHGEAKALAIRGGPAREREVAAAVFQLTGEPLPATRSSLDVEKVKKEVGWFVLTLGLKQILFPPSMAEMTRTVEPDNDDYRRVGPRATALFEGLVRGGTTGFFVPRSVEPEATLVVSFVTTEHSEDITTCSLSLSYEVPLHQPGKSMAEVIDALFAPGARRLREVASRRTFHVHNDIGAWSDAP